MTTTASVCDTGTLSERARLALEVAKACRDLSLASDEAGLCRIAFLLSEISKECAVALEIEDEIATVH
jgi:hypothetical protein